MRDSLRCNLDLRRAASRARGLNGMDYLQVSPDQRSLTVYFLGKLDPNRLPTRQNFVIDGGRKITGIRVVGVEPRLHDDPGRDDRLVLHLNTAGDFSTYTLRIVGSQSAGEQPPFEGFDPRYDRLEFSFKVDCPGESDCGGCTCGSGAATASSDGPGPPIHYLAKDYASFKQMLLDRLAVLLPDWTERHVPDAYLALVELLAYVGDYLSYYQDAVATEAYLATARRRVSVRRHARLVDYFMHDGCNARAWIVLTVDSTVPLGRDLDLSFTRSSDSDPSAAVVFERLWPPAQTLYPDHNEIHFYTWQAPSGNQGAAPGPGPTCCLSRGATTADLYGRLAAPGRLMAERPGDPPTLHLREGDVLILEEVRGPDSGAPADADLAKRHAVRLTRVLQHRDPLHDPPDCVVEVHWAVEDALPFTLCLSSIDRNDCTGISDVSVARGNVLLVDHGEHVEDSPAPVEDPEPETVCGDCCATPRLPRVNPPDIRLSRRPLTFAQPLPDPHSAARLLRQDPRRAMPEIRLTEERQGSPSSSWRPVRDLLSSKAADRVFVVETDETAVAHLRFGDGELGRRPSPGSLLRPRYRAGNGRAGNVAAGTIDHVSAGGNAAAVAGITGVRNPFAATGGADPEPIEEVKEFAPAAFMRELERAITPEDYAQLAQQNPAIQRAAAELRWNGAWYEARVAIDPLHGVEADRELCNAVRESLHKYRALGHDLAVVPANYVPLELETSICVRPGYLAAHVRDAVRRALTGRPGANAGGQQHFFHPDRLTFGQSIYVSRIEAEVVAVEGVESVRVLRLRRMYGPDENVLDSGVLHIGPLEVARLDDDPNARGNGTLVIHTGGGR